MAHAKEGYDRGKVALIYIYYILREHSNYDHPLTQAQIAAYLENEYKIELDRKAISRNVDILIEAGFEIVKGKGCYLDVRDFEDSELRLLIDAVLSSKVISARHSEDLIERISGLSSVYFKNSIKHVHNLKSLGFTETVYFKNRKPYIETL